MVKIPILGMGGIADARDALEFIIAGASAVQVGTANFVDPFIWPKLLDGITDYLQRHQIDRVSDSGRHARHPDSRLGMDQLLAVRRVTASSRLALVSPCGSPDE